MPPLEPEWLAMAREVLELYDKNSLIRLALRLGAGKTKELAAQSREGLTAVILERCARPEVMAKTLEGLTPLQLRLLEMAAAQYGVAEVGELLRAAMQAVFPPTTDPFDGLRDDLHERRRQAAGVLVELYSRALLWPVRPSQAPGADEGEERKRGDNPGGTGPRVAQRQVSLVGAYHLPGGPMVAVHPFIRHWLGSMRWSRLREGRAAEDMRLWWPWWSEDFIRGESGAAPLKRSLQALVGWLESRGPARLDRGGRPVKDLRETVVGAARGTAGGQGQAGAPVKHGEAQQERLVWASGPGGWVAFVMSIAEALGLVRRSKGALEAGSGEARARLERMAADELLQQACSAWLASEHFNELALCPELVVEGCPAYDEPPPALPRPFQREAAKLLQSVPGGDAFRKAARRARQAVARKIAQMRPGYWVAFEEFSEQLRWEQPGFLFERERAEERDVPRYAYSGLYERTPDGRALDLPAAAEWVLVEERLLARLLLGPMLAVGLVQVHWDWRSVVPDAFTVTPAARELVGRALE